MCVIAYTPEGVDLPNEEIRADMFYANNDGAGLAYVLNKRVYVEKGYMDLKEFENAIAGVEKKLKKHKLTPKDIPFLLHYRIGTHGPNSEGLTHPFPITQHNDFLQSKEFYSDVIVAHNGMISSINTKADVSDTVQYIKDVLLPLYRSNPEFYLDENIQDLVKNTIDGSRFIFLDRKGKAVTIGSWEEKKEAPGVMFSNLTFDYKPTYYYGHKYGKRNRTKTKRVIVKKVPKVDGFAVGRIKAENDVILYEKSLKDTTYYVDLLGQVYTDSYWEDNTITPISYYDLLFVNKEGEYEQLFSDCDVIADVDPEEYEVDYDQESGYYSRGGWRY